MRIDKKDYMLFDESSAFNELLSELRGLCLAKFESKKEIGWEGWIESENIDNILEGFLKNSDKIQQGGFSKDTIVNAINFLVMIYNLHEEINE
jgi:hypothetical protein